VFVNGRAALRVGDPGVHAACCGPNTWKAAKGSATVFVNGKAFHRLGDMTTHCGGVGKLVEGSPNVIVGDLTSAAKTAPIEEVVDVDLTVLDPFGNPVEWTAVDAAIEVDGATQRTIVSYKQNQERVKKGAKAVVKLSYDDDGDETPG
jgi:hypothetical protein